MPPQLPPRSPGPPSPPSRWNRRLVAVGLAALALAAPRGAAAQAASAGIEPPRAEPVSADDDGWAGPGVLGASAHLGISSCPFDPPALPRQTDVALDATLLVVTPWGTGSAVLVSPDGFALTAAHVVAGTDAVDVIDHAGNLRRGVVLRVDERQDAALLKVEWSGPTPCLAPIEQPAPMGSDVYVLGSPAGEELSFSVAKGIVSGYRKLAGVQWIQLDAAINPGNSGGPLVSAEGAIVGITSWKVTDVSMEGLAFAVPIHEALRALRVETREVPPPTCAGPEPIANATPAPDRQPAKPSRREHPGRGLIASGFTLAGLGIAGVVTTTAVHASLDHTRKATWTALQVGNAASWGTIAVGGSMALAGLLVRRKHRIGRAEVSLRPTINGARIEGRF